MSHVELKNVTKRFGGVTALNDITFDVHDGEFFVLLGPTGAGKTTTLRMIAGLEKPDTGQVLFDGEDMTALAPADRDVAFVFQQYSLYPNMTVYDNLAFPLRSPMRRTTEPEIKKRVEEIAAVLRITHLLTRKTAKLSGGEMQRVSIGRAIVRSPRIYLMDEPLSNLDAKLREALRVELSHLQKTQGSTTLFVTHDQIEALTMAERIAVLNHGRIVQIGSPTDIYDRPATTFVAQLVGSPKINLLRAGRERQQAEPRRERRPPASRGRVRRTAIACPRSSSWASGRRTSGWPASGLFGGEVMLVEPLGVETLLHIKVGGQTVVSTVSGMSQVKRGENVRFNLLQDRLHFFNPVSGERL